jgi:archaellum biogenesis protein FlaJ (TadC family)
MWTPDAVNQIQSYLSLKTSIVWSTVLLWNIAFIVAIIDSYSAENEAFTTQGAIIISVTLFSVCLFAIFVVSSKRFRNKVLEPKRAQNYRSKDFVLLIAVTLVLSLVMGFVAIGT